MDLNVAGGREAKGVAWETTAQTHMAVAFSVWGKQLVNCGMSMQKQTSALIASTVGRKQWDYGQRERRKSGVFGPAVWVRVCVGEQLTVGVCRRCLLIPRCVASPEDLRVNRLDLRFRWGSSVTSNENRDGIYSSYTWEHFTANHRLLVMTLSQQLTVSQNFIWLANPITSQCRPDDIQYVQQKKRNITRHRLAVHTGEV